MKGDSVKSKSGAELRAQRANRAAAPVATRQQQLEQYRSVIVRRQRDFVETGTALGLIAKEQLFKEAGFASFEAMVVGEFDMSTSTAYRLVDAARVVTILSQVGTVEAKIRNQTQALALAPLGKDRDAMVLVIAAAEARGRVTADLLAEMRVELYPHTEVIDGEVVEPARAVEGMRAAIEQAAAATAEPELPPETFRCENCNSFLPDGMVKAAQRRCLNCDVNRDHFAVTVGGPCVACKTAADGDTAPVELADAADVVAGTSSGPGRDEGSTGSGQGEERIEEEDGPCDRTDLPEDGEMHCACGFEAGEHPAWIARMDRIRADREARIDSPAADDLAPTSSQQPGSDSPTADTEDAMSSSPVVQPQSEAVHHPVEGSAGGVARDVSGTALAEPELEDDSITPAGLSSSSDPIDALVARFSQFALELIRETDPDALGPLLHDDDLLTLRSVVAELDAYVRRLSAARTP